jgi:uncharacterized protein YecT (DUF1311 family)
MPDWASQVVMLVIGGAGTAAWFHWRRRVERKPVFENIEKAHKLVALKKELDGTNSTLEDLKSLEDALMGRGEVAKALAGSYEQEANELRQLQQKSALTQAEMNFAAAQAYKRSTQKLESVIAGLKEYYSPQEIERFEDTQKAWLTYRDKHAAFLAAQYEGGSIQPLIHASALESVTIARIVELEAELLQARELLVPYREREP